LISDLDLPKEQKNLANSSATKGAHPKITLLLMIGRNVGDVRKEKFLLVRLQLARDLRLGIICFRQLEMFATGSTTNLFVG